jgi:hypothetical protein
VFRKIWKGLDNGRWSGIYGTRGGLLCQTQGCQHSTQDGNTFSGSKNTTIGGFVWMIADPYFKIRRLNTRIRSYDDNPKRTFLEWRFNLSATHGRMFHKAQMSVAKSRPRFPHELPLVKQLHPTMKKEPQYSHSLSSTRITYKFKNNCFRWCHDTHGEPRVSVRRFSMLIYKPSFHCQAQRLTAIPIDSSCPFRLQGRTFLWRGSLARLAGRATSSPRTLCR